MTTAINTNVLVSLWNEDDSLNTMAHTDVGAPLGRAT